MTTNPEIKVGDIVSVNFNNAQITLSGRAEVLYLPQATGDSWRIRDIATNTLYYISEGCTVMKEDPEHKYKCKSYS